MLLKLKIALDILKKKGFKSFLKEITIYIYRHFIRDLTPTTGYLEYAIGLANNPIVIDEKKYFFDKFFSSYYKVNPKRELGLRLAHVALTRMGDHVVIIGGGEGLSAITAAQQIGKKGKLTIYDGLEDERNVFGTRKIQRNLELNGVPPIWVIKHGFVTSRNNDLINNKTYDTEFLNEKTPIIHPSELPECDVLETDCNGAELLILQNMKIRPRVLIIELEAAFYKKFFDNNEHPRDVLKLLNEIGYTIIKQTGHEGIPIDYDQLLHLIDVQYDLGKKYKLENGAQDSPIIYAVRNDFIQILKN
jgi:hypothetical protein